MGRIWKCIIENTICFLFDQAFWISWFLINAFKRRTAIRAGTPTSSVYVWCFTKMNFNFRKLLGNRRCRRVKNARSAKWGLLVWCINFTRRIYFRAFHKVFCNYSNSFNLFGFYFCWTLILAGDHTFDEPWDYLSLTRTSVFLHLNNIPISLSLESSKKSSTWR